MATARNKNGGEKNDTAMHVGDPGEWTAHTITSLRQLRRAPRYNGAAMLPDQ